MSKPKLIVVGNGMAGVRTLEELCRIAPDRYDITVFGAEPHPNYNRIMLSPVLAGELSVQDIILNDFDWYRRMGIQLVAGQKIVEIDRGAHTVRSADGQTHTYDRLLLATGSTPFIPPVPGSTLPGVHAYRDIADADAMIEAAARYRHAVVIGGGLLGLEAANGLALRGMAVTVVHLGEWIMERQLDRPAAGMLQAALQAKGLQFRLAAQTASLVQGESGRVCAVTLQSGESLPADLVVMAAGIRPNTAVAEAAGLLCQRGIVVNDALQTSDPDIYSVGECANHRGVAYGLVAPLFEQAEVVARQLASDGAAAYHGSVTSTKLKVTGIDVFSAGNFMGGAGCEDIVLSDPAGGVYKRVVIQEDRIVGALAYGDTTDGAWYFQMIRAGENVAGIRHHLLFGQPQTAVEHCH
jgi:nitrite reductase (NADH) large subunit